MNYKRIYDNIIENAKLRGLNKKLLNYYTEKHHIIPKCLNGTNDKNNLVLLTAREHFICHQLLWKLNKSNYKLFYSFRCMCMNSYLTSSRYKTLTSKQHEILRYNFSLIKRQERLGIKLTDEHKNKISHALKGNVHKTDEEKYLISLRMKNNKHGLGHTMSEENKQKLINSAKTRVVSNETKMKMRLNNLGRKHSNEINSKKGCKGLKNKSSKQCYIDENLFYTLNDAANYVKFKYGFSKGKMVRLLNSGINENFKWGLYEKH